MEAQQAMEGDLESAAVAMVGRLVFAFSRFEFNLGFACPESLPLHEYVAPLIRCARGTPLPRLAHRSPATTTTAISAG